VSSLTRLFKPVQVPEQENEKLVDLFRSRIALKKKFAALRDEKYQLLDRIKEHRGSIERVEQKLNHLEALLLDPEWVHNVAVFYQLRSLASQCESRLSGFAETLKRQQEERISKFALSEWSHEREQERAAIETGLNEQREKTRAAEDRLAAARQNLGSMNRVSRLLLGRSHEQAVGEAEVGLKEARDKENVLLKERERIEQSGPPPHEGLDVTTKRSVNFLILSFGQQLYLDYLEDDLTNLAKEAQQKSPGAVKYGTRGECDQLLESLERRRQEVDGRIDPTELLQRRAQLLAESATFRRDDDAVPVPATVAMVLDIDAEGIVTTIDANLLGENYFGIARYLSR
jgi:hypothetical protein